MYARILLLMILFPLSLLSQDDKREAKQPQQSPTPNQYGTDQSPFVVKQLAPLKTEEDVKREEEERKEKSENDRDAVKLTAALAAIALGQLGVYAYQAHKLRETVKAAGEQSQAMERHIGEAARSAKAMEDMVAAIEKGNKAVMRAYLTVAIGLAVHQERREGQGDLRFEGKPKLTNTGSTQARRVISRIKAEILDLEAAKGFDFPIPEVPEAELLRYQVVGSHHDYYLSGVVNGFVPDEEVAAIKEGRGRALFVWGRVTYEDIFGDQHYTNFCQQITWWPNGTIFCNYVPGHNDAD
jgi:hypothetical protein